MLFHQAVLNIIGCNYLGNFRSCQILCLLLVGQRHLPTRLEAFVCPADFALDCAASSNSRRKPPTTLLPHVLAQTAFGQSGLFVAQMTHQHLFEQCMNVMYVRHEQLWRTNVTRTSRRSLMTCSFIQASAVVLAEREGDALTSTNQGLRFL